MTCSTASNSGKFAWSGVGIGEGTTLKGITFRLSDFFFNKGLEDESGFFIATPRIFQQLTLQLGTMKHGNPANVSAFFGHLLGGVQQRWFFVEYLPEDFCWIPPWRFLLNISLKILVQYIPEDFCWKVPGDFCLISPWRFFVEYLLEDFHSIPPWRFLLRSFPRLYIIVSNNSTVVEIYIWWLALLHETWVTLNLVHTFYNQPLVLVTFIPREHNAPEPPR